MKRLAILCTHPIQYYAPLFSLLANSNINLKVFYTWGEESLKKHDPGFNKVIEWDIPLLEGYDYTFLKNTAKVPGSSHFSGIKNPTLINDLTFFKPNAILVFGWAYHSHLKVIRHFKNKIPVWFRGDSTLLNSLPLVKHTVRRIFLKWVYSHIDLAFYVGFENKRYYKEFGLKDEQLIFAPHAIDNTRFFNFPESTRTLVRKALNIDEEHIVVLFAGKLEDVKNPQLLLQAFLDVNLKNTHLIFVGQGVLEAKLKDRAAGNGNIHFVGFQNQSSIPAYYHACDLFCLPSLSETWGLAVNEAMACGKAVLVSDKVGCAADLVQSGLNGDIFISNNTNSLRKKLLNLLCSESVLKEYGKASKEIIKNWNFKRSCDVIANQLYKKDYSSTLKNRG